MFFSRGKNNVTCDAVSYEECKEKIGSVENHPPDDAPGASPRRWSTPVTIMLYFPDQAFSAV